MSGRAPITKITRPRTMGTVFRQRLFRRLDAGHNIIWLTGPPGSGKTTLAASYLDARKLPCLWYRLDEADADVSIFFYYMGVAAKRAAPRYRRPMPLLTPEYAFGIPVFAKRYFEELFLRLKPPLVLVFDNFQEVPRGSIFHEVMRKSFASVPEGIRILIASRSDPPVEFASLRAGSGFLSLGWDEIRFSRDEYKDIIRSRGLENKNKNKNIKIPGDILSGLHDKTQGWVSGLMLFLEHARHGNIPPESINMLSDLSQKAVFDYFAGEILRKMDEETRAFLLKTALLPKMTPLMAEELTGNKLAGRILSGLGRDHFFTERHSAGEPGYRYHSLFREFLLAQLKESAGSEEIGLLRNRAASVLEKAGQIEDAAFLYRDAGNWERMAALVLGNADLLLRQGRNQTLRGWLSGIPEELFESNPWLLYWSGICSMGYGGARGELEKAFGRFKEMDDRLGMVLSWSFIILASQLEWSGFNQFDELIAVFFEEIEKALPSTPLPVQARAISSIGTALMTRRPDHPRTAALIEKALSLAAECRDADSGMHAISTAIIYYSWTGDPSRCIALIEQAWQPKSLAYASHVYWLLVATLNAGRYIWDVSEAGGAEKRISEALEFAEKTGVHTFDPLFHFLGANSALMTTDMERAKYYLEKMRSQAGKDFQVQYRTANCLYHFLEGNFSRALTEAETGLKLEEATGYVFARILLLHGLAQALHALKDGRAQECLEQALGLAVQSKSAVLEFGCRLARAQFALDDGKEGGMELKLLSEALSLGREHGYYSLLYWWDPQTMSRLCAKALENGIEPGYVGELIRLRRINPDGLVHIENWPWPLKVYTLGKFEMIKDGKPLIFTGKVQQRPLEMLKVLIALGGKGVSEEQVADALWPEAEGDAAHLSFRANLHRLRKLTGNEKAIELKGGRVTLDRRHCWADIWAFEHALEEALSSSPQDIKAIEKALALYSGDFLPADVHKPWSVSMRERIKGNFLQCVRALAGHYERSGDLERAVECLKRGIEADELAEDFYRGVMACYHLMGRRPDALSAYERCRRTLAAVFGLKPSIETEKLKENILKN